MFENILHRNVSGVEREITVTMNAKKPVTLWYVPPEGEPILLAKETTTFKGVISVRENIPSLQWRFEGERLITKNRIRLEFG